VGDRGSTGESHVARLFKFAPPMCSVHSRTGHGHALRLVRIAARQLTAVAQPLQGPLASARSCVPLRVRSITTGVSHLYRADPSSGHQAPMLLCNAGGCDDGSAARRTCSCACPRWPTLIRRPGVPCASKRRANRSPEWARSVRHTSGEVAGAASATIPAPECALSVFRN